MKGKANFAFVNVCMYTIYIIFLKYISPIFMEIDTC